MQKKSPSVHEGRHDLQSKAEEINKDLVRSEDTKLKELGKTRRHYEKLVSDVKSGLA